MYDTLKIAQYHDLAQRTSPNDGHDRIDNGVLGLLGETGELVDLYKKWVYQSKYETEFPAQAAANELGDVLWYLEELSTGLGSTLAGISYEPFVQLDKLVRRSEAPRPKIRRIILSLSHFAHQIYVASEHKKWLEVKAYIRKMLVWAAWLAEYCGVTLGEVAAGNINKLIKRYPDGFDAEISMARSGKEYAEH